MTNVVPIQNPKDLTPSERERVERLVWTQDQGKGWVTREINSSDLPYLRMAAESFEARQAPASREIIVALLARLANHFRSERPGDAWQMLFEDYAADLDGISDAHLREVIASHRKERNWFPKIAELTERWNALRHREAEQFRRARVLMGLEQPKSWERGAARA